MLPLFCPVSLSHSLALAVAFGSIISLCHATLFVYSYCVWIILLPFFPSVLFLAINLFGSLVYARTTFAALCGLLLVCMCMNSFWLCYTIFLVVIIAITSERGRERGRKKNHKFFTWKCVDRWKNIFHWIRLKTKQKKWTKRYEFSIQFFFGFGLHFKFNHHNFSFSDGWTIFFSIRRNIKKGLIGWCQLFDIYYIFYKLKVVIWLSNRNSYRVRTHFNVPCAICIVQLWQSLMNKIVIAKQEKALCGQ